MLVSNNINVNQTIKQIRVIHPVIHVKVKVDPVPQGQISHIKVKFCSGPEFKINIDFGDNSVTPDVQRADKVSEHCYQTLVEHLYTQRETYHVQVNVSSPFSWMSKETFAVIGEPITGLVVTSDSPEVINLEDHEVIVIATVESGENVDFQWYSSDQFPSDFVSKM